MISYRRKPNVLPTSSAKLLFTLSVFLLLAACGGTSNPTPSLTAEAIFATSVPMSTMNTVVTLRYLKPQPPEKQLENGLTFILENQSDQEVWFPADFGEKFYQYSETDNQWQMMDYRVQYPQNGISNGIILAPHGFSRQPNMLSWEGSVTAYPKFDNLTQSIVTRTVVLGNIYNHGNKGEPVGAYIDVVITP
jgi:hypothetical protein